MSCGRKIAGSMTPGGILAADYPVLMEGGAMKIKLIDFGVPEGQRPYRPHGNDAGADVYMPYDCTLQPGEIAKIPLGFGIEVPGWVCRICVPPQQHGRQRAGLRAAACRFRLPRGNPRDP